MVTEVAKLVNLNVLGVDTVNVDVQFIYENCEFDDILAKITKDIVIGLVYAGFLALKRLITPALVVSAENKLLKITS